MKIFRQLLLLLCLILMQGIKAQTIRDLNYDIFQVQNGDYVKDSNNDLSKFTGEWNATLADKKVTLQVSILSHIPYPFSDEGINYFMDCLLVRYKVADLNGNVLQETLSQDFSLDDNLKIISVRYKASESLASLIANPNSCHVGMGIVYLKWLGQNSLEWEYQPMTAQITDQDCWNHQERLKIYLPTNQKVIFTRQ